MDASDAQTEFLAELLHEELYDGCTGDGKTDVSDGVDEGKHADDGLIDTDINVDSCDITAEVTHDDDDDEVEFVLGDNDMSRTPLSILKAEVLGFGNDDIEKPSIVGHQYRRSCHCQLVIIPETPVFDQISMINLDTSQTPLFNGSVLNSLAGNRSGTAKHFLSDDDNKVRTKLFKSGTSCKENPCSPSVNVASAACSPSVNVASAACSPSLNVATAEAQSNKDNLLDNNRTGTTVSLSTSTSKTEEQKTPLKSLENLPIHETSPFIKKLCTDKVTKRTRRKRQIKGSIDTSDWSDMSDTMELCDKLNSPSEPHIANKDSDAETEYAETNLNQSLF